MSDHGGASSDLGEGSSQRLAGIRLPPLELQAKRAVSLVDDGGSHLAQSGLDPVGVQRQMGHARPSITMDLYVHEFETARRREQVGEHLVAALGGLVRDLKSDQI